MIEPPKPDRTKPPIALDDDPNASFGMSASTSDEHSEQTAAYDVWTEKVSAAYELLKEATVLKKAKKYDEACTKLRDAYALAGENSLMIEVTLRLPMYLQLAGKNDEGWDELCRLFTAKRESHVQIVYQMKIFCDKEGGSGEKRKLSTFVQWSNKKTAAVNVKRRSPIKIRDAQGNVDYFLDGGTITGFMFEIRPSISIPLRVLLHALEIHCDPLTSHPALETYIPPLYTPPQGTTAHEFTYGSWRPIRTPLDADSVASRNGAEEAKLIERLSADDARNYSVATEAGAHLESEYFPFVIAVRKIVELEEPIDDRVEKLRSLILVERWQVFVENLSRNRSIIDQFFPPFINLAPGLDTPNRIAAASDETLLWIAGIGARKLIAIRERCAQVVLNRDCDRVDAVVR